MKKRKIPTRPGPNENNKRHINPFMPNVNPPIPAAGTATSEIQQKFRQASLFFANRNYAQAWLLLRDILHDQPDHCPALVLLGRVSIAAGDFKTAISALSHAINTNCATADCYSMLGYAYIRNHEFGNALHLLDKGISIDPGHKIARTNKATCLTKLGRIDEAIEEYLEIIKLDQGYYPAWMNYLLDLNGIQGISNQQVFDAHKRFGKTVEPNIEAHHDWSSHNLDPCKVIKVGYLSSDFRTHSVAYFIESILKNHSASRIETYCYHASEFSDVTTRRLKSYVQHWRNVAELGDTTLADRIYEDGIDILVDLNGHTSGSRIRTLTFKPAPVQVSWLGYPNTTGLHSVDYRITDAVADPNDESDRYYTERLLRLPGCFLCYTPPDNPPRIGDLPALRNRYVTYGSFNSNRKINNAVLNTWISILNRVPDSRLLLKNPGLGNKESRLWIKNYLIQRGITRERIILLGIDTTTEEHLERYNLVDIGLDTFPYNGTTTTCEALYMGVPVITQQGDNHRSRVGASLLHSAGMKEFIASSTTDYINLACELANNVDLINDYRKNTRKRMIMSALCDDSAFTHKLEEAYRGIWGQWCAQFNDIET